MANKRHIYPALQYGWFGEFTLVIAPPPPRGEGLAEAVLRTASAKVDCKKNIISFLMSEIQLLIRM